MTSLNIGEDNIGKNITEQIDECLAVNEKFLIQRQDQFIQTMIILAHNSMKGSHLSLWNQLPKELRLYIIGFLGSHASIGKSGKQIVACAMFIMENTLALNASLQEAIQTKQRFKVIENTKTGHFRFFPSKTSNASTCGSIHTRREY